MPTTTLPPPRPPAPAITASALTRAFDGVEVVRGLDLDVEPGTVLGLIGPSGCGKTTTVRLLTGLLAPTSGEARIRGRLATEMTRTERARIGYLPQSPALFPELSLTENLAFHASMYGLPLRRRRRLDALLDWVELDEHRRKRVDEVSGGMRRRLALAAAFVQDPDVAFLDEPTAGIDPILRDKFWAHFRELADDGTTLLVTTQYVGEAGKCDLVGLLSDGELLLLDTPEHLRRAAFEGEVVDLTLAAPVAPDVVARLQQHRVVVGSIDQLGPQELRIVVDDARVAVDELRAACAEIGVEVRDVVEHLVDFDEAFVRIVERHRRTNATSDDDAGDAGDDLTQEPADAHA